MEGGDLTGHFVQVIDISQSGVRLLTHRRYEAGSRLQIRLTNAADLFSHRAVVTVRFAVGTSDGSHVTGCEFLQSLTYDHLRALLLA
jgi:alpha/beta superfamily hydrolase